MTCLMCEGTGKVPQIFFNTLMCSSCAPQQETCADCLGTGKVSFTREQFLQMIAEFDSGVTNYLFIYRNGEVSLPRLLQIIAVDYFMQRNNLSLDHVEMIRHQIEFSDRTGTLDLD